MTESRFLIDTAFIIERIHKTFFGTPLLMDEEIDHTFAFGFLRDFMRLRRKLGIKTGVLVIGKEAHSLTTVQNIEDVVSILQGLKIPCIHDPVNIGLHIIGSICSRFSHVVTGERRLIQLSSNDLIVVLVCKDSRDQCDWISAETVRTVMGVAPADVPTYLALTEASSTTLLTTGQAVRLIELYGNLDSIYKNLSKVASFPIRKKLVEYKSRIRQHYTESKIKRIPEPIPYNVKNASPRDLDTKSNRQLLKTYGFQSLLGLLENPSNVRLELHRSKLRPGSYHAVVDGKGIQELEALILSSKVCSIDTESDDRDPREATVLGVAFSVKEGEACFVPLIENDLKSLKKDDVLKFLQRIFDSDVDFIGHNIKYDYLLLRRSGIRIKSIHFDTMLAAYDCHGDWSFFNLRYLAKRFLDKEIKSYSDLVDEDSTFLDMPFKEIVDHACQDADVTMRLYPILMNELEERGITAQYSNHTMQMLKRLGDIEFQGIAANEKEINRIKRSLVKQATRLKSDICEKLGKAFDLDSERELSAVLRETLDLWRYIGQKRFTLVILEQLATSEPLVRLIVEYKRLRSRIIGMESISAAVTDGKIHPLFNQISSRAGLVTTIRPSLFGIDALPKLRSCFHSSVHDYFRDKQRSLDTLARLTQDTVLLKVRSSKYKVDTLMANHPLMNELDHDELLLSLVLGQSESKLSRKFLLERFKITTIKHDLRKRYQTMFRWLDNYRRMAQTKGYATIDGKRKYVDGLKSSDLDRRERALEHVTRWLIDY